MRKAKLIFLLAALAAAALFSCAVSESPASSDSGLVSMFREKLTEEAELSSSENTQILPSGIDDDATVYWVKSGSVYHRDPDCAQLRISSDIMSGTAAQRISPAAFAAEKAKIMPKKRNCRPATPKAPGVRKAEAVRT